MKKNLVDIVSLAVVGAVVGGVALANLFQPNRPTVSEAEKRELAKMPAFSWESLADGSYFNDISSFVSDTFLARDSLVTFSKQLDVLKGVDYQVDGDGSFVLLDAGRPSSDASPSDSGTSAGNAEEPSAAMDDFFKEAFENLNRPPVESKAPETAKKPPKTNGKDPETAEIAPETTESTPEAAETAPETAETAPETAETAPETAETAPETTETAPETAETAPAVRGLSLSKTSITLTVGSGTVIHAYLDADVPGNVSWSVSDSSIAALSVNPNGGIDVKGVSEGTCTITCRYEDLFVQTCVVTVNAIPTTTPPSQTNLQADFLTDGMFIYGDAVHTQAFYSETNATYYAQTAAYYKKLFGENTRVSIVVAPVSSMVVDNEAVKAKIPDQQVIMDKMAALVDPSVNFVDTYTPMYEHRSEYLFFKSDHHWTQRGAYYAYTAFAQSVGLTPTPLDDFDYLIRNENYSGSMYMYTQDARVRNFTDVIEAFVSKKPCTMTVTGQYGTIYNYDTTVVPTNNTYVTFIAGDNPYTVINVPDNPQDFNALVLKDSFGNAFVPFLCEHYGNIIVVDTRYSTFNIYDQLKDYGISDILFINNIQAANSSTWWKMYLSAVGVSTP